MKIKTELLNSLMGRWRWWRDQERRAKPLRRGLDPPTDMSHGHEHSDDMGLMQSRQLTREIETVKNGANHIPWSLAKGENMKRRLVATIAGGVLVAGLTAVPAIADKGGVPNDDACFGQAASGFASTSKSNATGKAVSAQAQSAPGARSEFVRNFC